MLRFKSSETVTVAYLRILRAHTDLQTTCTCKT